MDQEPTSCDPEFWIEPKKGKGVMIVHLIVRCERCGCAIKTRPYPDNIAPNPEWCFECLEKNKRGGGTEPEEASD